MAHGKNINVFLMDNTPVGRIKCTLSNWTGTVYKIPRTVLEKCNDRDDLKQSGVYFLFGTSDETEKPLAYIGQAGTRKMKKASSIDCLSTGKMIIGTRWLSSLPQTTLSVLLK